MALGTSRDRGIENEKRAVDGMMERGNLMLQEVPVETSSRYVSILYEKFLLYVYSYPTCTQGYLVCNNSS